MSERMECLAVPGWALILTQSDEPSLLRNQSSRNRRIIAGRDVHRNAEIFVGLQVVGIQVRVRHEILPGKYLIASRRDSSKDRLPVLAGSRHAILFPPIAALDVWNENESGARVRLALVVDHDLQMAAVG